MPGSRCINTSTVSRRPAVPGRLLGLCLLSLWLAACTVAAPTASPAATTPATPSGLTPLPTAATPAGPASTAASPSSVTTLRIWLPPEFSPSDTALPGSSVLADQVAQFEQGHPNVVVQTRVKVESGPGGLLHALTAANNVAPSVLPNIIALNRDDLAAAASAGLVIPLDKYFPADSLTDLYPFAQMLSRGTQGQLIGLPFATDAQVLAYLSYVYATSPLTWTTVTTGTLIFPGADPAALTLLNEYLALGGSVTDSTGKVALQPETLAAALTFFRSARDAGLLPLSTMAYADSAATWQAFRQGRATLAVTSARLYLAEPNPPPAIATLLPAPGGKPLALAQPWSWAIVNTQAEHQAAAAALVTWLVDPQHLADWTQAAGLLPVRTSVLARWKSSARTAFADQTLAQAQLPPPAQVLSVVGPPLQQALADVLNDRATAASAAAVAVQTIEKP
jgi:ABC-type glycerol-3-phosphate transport system substrate-binding protein